MAFNIWICNTPFTDLCKKAWPLSVSVWNRAVREPDFGNIYSIYNNFDLRDLFIGVKPMQNAIDILKEFEIEIEVDIVSSQVKNT